MGSLSAADLIGTPVRLHGILLGRATDLLLDASARRVLGFVVESGDDATRFLPFAASQPGEHGIDVASALMLLDDVAFYRKHGVSFRSLLGSRIERENAFIGALIGMHLSVAGDVVELEVDNDGARIRMVASDARFTPSAATAA
jgi:PRC-barrel domain